MNTPSTFPRLHNFMRKVLVLAGLCLALKFQATAQAASIYNYTLNTTPLNGTSGVLIFEFVPGDLTVNNSVTVDNFSTDGTLLAVSSAFLDDANGLAEDLRDITFGTFLSFRVTLSENFDGSLFSDGFAFYLFDPTLSFSLADTDNIYDALFTVEINGVPGGAANSYPGQLTPATASVPDIGGTLPLLLLSFGSAGAFGVIRKFRAKPAQV